MKHEILTGKKYEREKRLAISVEIETILNVTCGINRNIKIPTTTATETLIISTRPYEDDTTSQGDYNAS